MKTNHPSSMFQVFKLALPLAGSRLISTFMGFVGAILLSHYNATSLAASALISATQVTLISAGMSIVFSTSILVGQLFGGKQYDKINNVLQQAIILALLISLLLMMIFWSIGPILHFLQQPKPIIVVVEQYFQVFSFGVPAILMITATQQALFAIQKQFLALAVDFISLVLTSVLGVGLIYGKFGCPELGVSGLAYAIVIQAWVLTFGLLYCVNMNSFFDSFKFKIDQQILCKLFHIGWPISISITGEILSLFAITIMAGWLGINALNAIQITSQYLLLLVIPIFGISQAIAILTSHLLGARQESLLKTFGWSAMKLAYVPVGIAFIIVILFPTALMTVFMNTSDIANKMSVHLASISLTVIVLGQFFDVLRNICSGALRAMGFTIQPMFVSMACLWLLALPLAYILGFTYHFGLIGMLIAYDLGMLLAGITLYKFWVNRATICESYVTSHTLRPEIPAQNPS
ncbi:MAG: MATE family efflux transporter [Gammaproteobacteria bacterium]|nr:MATE family efflux transporter [Gammaproteobacteria bacterium]